MDASLERLHYLALGDSYTIGEGVEPAQRWPQQLVAALRAAGIRIDDPQIIARTGWTTDELSAALDRAERGDPLPEDGNSRSLRPTYGLVTVLIGVNNQYRGRPLAEYRQQLRTLLERAIGYAGGDSRRVIVVSIPDWGVTPFASEQGRDRAQVAAAIDAYNASKRELAQELGLGCIDITPSSREAADRPELVAADGLHPSGLEYARWVERLLPVALRVAGME